MTAPISRLFPPARLHSSSCTWDYWRSDDTRLIEFGTVHGMRVGLPTHFHIEDQITFVLSGRRRFFIGSSLIEVSAGQAVRIPAGMPHQSLSESAEIMCVNLYTNGSAEEARSLLTDMAGQPFEMINCATANVLALDCRDIGFLRSEPVSHTASRIGMTREGYSRKIKEIHGLSPQKILLNARLNDARQSLRRGLPIAVAAASAGFSDQSHLGRCFLRAFGVTPGHYRRCG